MLESYFLIRKDPFLIVFNKVRHANKKYTVYNVKRELLFRGLVLGIAAKVMYRNRPHCSPEKRISTKKCVTLKSI